MTDQGQSPVYTKFLVCPTCLSSRNFFRGKEEFIAMQIFYCYANFFIVFRLIFFRGGEQKSMRRRGNYFRGTTHVEESQLKASK